MSHYAVAVFHHLDQDIDELLAPYSENIEVPKYIEFTKQQAIDYIRTHNASYKDESDEACYNAKAQDYEPDMIDEDGNLYSTYNPISKWDWYCLGGRFYDYYEFNDKADEDDDYCTAMVSHIKFERDEEKYQECIRFWHSYVEGQSEDSDGHSVYYLDKDYYIKRYGDAETYADVCAQFYTYAVVTPDGEWHAPGEIGWFGMSSENGEEWADWVIRYHEQFIQPAIEQGLYLTIVDCHI